MADDLGTGDSSHEDVPGAALGGWSFTAPSATLSHRPWSATLSQRPWSEPSTFVSSASTSTVDSSALRGTSALGAAMPRPDENRGEAGVLRPAPGPAGARPQAATQAQVPTQSRAGTVGGGTVDDHPSVREIFAAAQTQSQPMSPPQGQPQSVALPQHASVTAPAQRPWWAADDEAGGWRPPAQVPQIRDASSGPATPQGEVQAMWEAVAGRRSITFKGRAGNASSPSSNSLKTGSSMGSRAIGLFAALLFIPGVFGGVLSWVSDEGSVRVEQAQDGGQAQADPAGAQLDVSGGVGSYRLPGGWEVLELGPGRDSLVLHQAGDTARLTVTRSEAAEAVEAQCAAGIEPDGTGAGVGGEVAQIEPPPINGEVGVGHLWPRPDGFHVRWCAPDQGRVVILEGVHDGPSEAALQEAMELVAETYR
ncbi:hypothetical protein ACTQ49_11180 [Luteococcus sp. Sow4_B9]|uniref:hypothetical protein n=1 Tax=Luteococcus sp. Sow4_B9 TaxID=3438792 RepID=UPI003F997FC7